MRQLRLAGLLSLALMFPAASTWGALVYTAPSIGIPPTVTSGSGALIVTDIGDPMPSPDVVPINGPPTGMRYTNREIKYTVAPGDLGVAAPPVMIQWSVDRPYSVTGSSSTRRAGGRVNGEIELIAAGGGSAVFDGFSMTYRAFFTGPGGEIADTSRILETPTETLAGSGSASMFPSPGGKLKTPSGESGKGTLPVGTAGDLVGTIKIQFTPTNVGDMIILRYPSSFEVLEVPEPSTLALATIGLFGGMLFWRRRRR